MLRQLRAPTAQLADDLGHGRHGVGALPRLARVRRLTRHRDLEPGASLVSDLDLPVGGLGVDDPLVRADEAGGNRRLDAAHEVLLVDGEKQREGAAGKRALGRRLVEQREERGDRAGEAALHVAGAAAVEPVARDDASERRRGVVPAVAERHGVHVAGVDERWLGACAGNADHEVAPVGERLDLCYADCLGKPVRQRRHMAFHQVFYVLLDSVLIGPGVRALDAHELGREPPRELIVDHMHRLRL